MISKRKRESLKRDLYNQWIIFKRMPLLIIYMSAILGTMSLIVWILGNIVRLILEA